MRDEDRETLERGIREGWVDGRTGRARAMGIVAWPGWGPACLSRHGAMGESPDSAFAAALREQLKVRLGREVWTAVHFGAVGVAWVVGTMSIHGAAVLGTRAVCGAAASDEHRTEIAALLAALEATHDQR